MVDLVTKYSKSLSYIFIKVRYISRELKNAKENNIKNQKRGSDNHVFLKTIESSYFIKESNTKHPEIVGSGKMEISMKKDMLTDLKLEN